MLILEAALDRDGGGRSRVLAPKALDADEESEAEESDDSDDDSVSSVSHFHFPCFYYIGKVCSSKFSLLRSLEDVQGQIG